MTRAQELVATPSTSADERLAIVAHEMRTPLSALANAAQALARYASEPSTVIRISGIVSRQTTAMQALVEELLDATRVDKGRVVLRQTPLDLCDVARSVVEDHGDRFDRAGLTCELGLCAPPVMVNGDALKLRQVLGNLLSNAIKFTSPPGRVCVVVERSGDTAILRVSDTGVGFSADLLPEIFDRYRQASRGSFGGLGLGLPIAKGLVELHGGEIAAFSDGPGKGCTMTIRLPLLAAA